VTTPQRLDIIRVPIKKHDNLKWAATMKLVYQKNEKSVKALSESVVPDD
jgi:hypothetical protein